MACNDQINDEDLKIGTEKNSKLPSIRNKANSRIGQSLSWSHNGIISSISNSGRNLTSGNLVLGPPHTTKWNNQEVLEGRNYEPFYLSFDYDLLGQQVGGAQVGEIVLELHNQFSGLSTRYDPVHTAHFRIFRHNNSITFRVLTANAENGDFPFPIATALESSGKTANHYQSGFVEITHDDIKINGVSILDDPQFSFDINNDVYETDIIYNAVTELEVRMNLSGGYISDIVLEGFGEKAIAADCECIEDGTELDQTINYVLMGGGQASYEITWSNMPSDYTNPRLGYTTYGGNLIYGPSGFSPCESGCTIITAPLSDPNNSASPKSFWVKAQNKSGSWRTCGDSVGSYRFFQVENLNSNCY